jgi:hypothetical protein
MIPCTLWPKDPPLTLTLHFTSMGSTPEARLFSASTSSHVHQLLSSFLQFITVTFRAPPIPVSSAIPNPICHMTQPHQQKSNFTGCVIREVPRTRQAAGQKNITGEERGGAVPKDLRAQVKKFFFFFFPLVLFSSFLSFPSGLILGDGRRWKSSGTRVA